MPYESYFYTFFVSSILFLHLFLKLVFRNYIKTKIQDYTYSPIQLNSFPMLTSCMEDYLLFAFEDSLLKMKNQSMTIN